MQVYREKGPGNENLSCMKIRLFERKKTERVHYYQ